MSNLEIQLPARYAPGVPTTAPTILLDGKPLKAVIQIQIVLNCNDVIHADIEKVYLRDSDSLTELPVTDELFSEEEKQELESQGWEVDAPPDDVVKIRKRVLFESLSIQGAITPTT